MDGDELSQHLIYHRHSSSSPGFDIPDYLPLRRVKPLPKRKRSSPDSAAGGSPSSSSLSPLSTTTAMLPPILPPPPGPDATAEELIAHAEVLSAQITLQSYFLPNLSNSGSGTISATGGVADFSRGVEMPLVADPPAAAVTSDQLDVIVAHGQGGYEGGDQMDHTQQQGNAKKRKVPAHLSGPQMGPDAADVHSGEEEQQQQQQGERTLRDGFTTCPAVAGSEDEANFNCAEAVGRQGRVLPATMVGLRQKQVLKHRRRQLAALLGSSPTLGDSDSDSLALDQALLANYALLKENRSGVGRYARLKSRLIRRRASRVVRRHRPLPPPPPPPRLPSEPTCRIFADSEFTFLSSNAASERLVTTRAEYVVLCNRFEHELVRQAEKVAASAKESVATGIGAVGGGGATISKRSERAVRKARTTTQSVQDPDVPAVPNTPSSTKTSGKKKKRSALANASNPHHLRNYVPSRIPNQGQLSAAQLGANAQSLLSPLPFLFLSAQVPPRRGTQQQRASAVGSQLANPAEEWICPTCEYRLFYGDEQGYRTGVRNRKKILKRRRRARERAAAAANGSGTGAGLHGKGSGLDDEEDLDIEQTGSGLALSQTRLAKGEREKGGGDREQVEVGAPAG